MKTPTNQLRAIFAAMIMLIATLPSFAHGFEVDGIYYHVLNETVKSVEVTYGENEYSGSITIPSSVTYKGISYSVTQIGYASFCDCINLTSISIPNSVTKIDSYALINCIGLTAINIPNSVTSIYIEAFSGCTGLTEFTIPNSVNKIDIGAFSGCTGLASITIPNSVVEIGEMAFCFCPNLTSIVVEKGNAKYDSRDNCNAIIETETNHLITGCKNTIIPNSVTKIGEDAFSDCIGLTSITIPNSVTEIGKRAFYGCSSLKSIIIQNPDVIIDEDAIPEEVEVIVEK